MDTGNRHRHLATTLMATMTIYLMGPLVIAVARPGLAVALTIALVFGVAGAIVGATMVHVNNRRVLGVQVGRSRS